MTELLNRLSVRNRIWTLVAILIGSMFLGIAVDQQTLRNTLRGERESSIRQMVESGHGVLNHYYKLQQRGELSETAAQAAALSALNDIRYNGKEYFWVNDLSEPEPKMIMHPIIPALNGKPLTGEKYNCVTAMRPALTGPFQQTDGKKSLTHAFFELASTAGFGYLTYSWPKALPNGGASEKAYPKLAYVMKFAPWGWVIGSGIYIDDIEDAIHQHAFENLLLLLLGGAVLLVISGLSAQSITRPLHTTMQTMHDIATGKAGLDKRVPCLGESEISQLARSFNEMLDQIEQRDKALEAHSTHLEEAVANRTMLLHDANLALDSELNERKIAQAALHESEETFRSITSTAQDGIIMIDEAGKITYWNPAAETIFGFAANEVQGKDMHLLFAPDRFHASFEKGFREFRQHGRGGAIGQTIEIVALRRDGSEFPIELSISSIHLRGEWCAVGFVRDISERKLNERKLSESKSRMRALLDSTEESVMLLGREGDILEINTFAAQRFGKSATDLIGQNFFSLMPPNLRESRSNAVRYVADTGQPTRFQDIRAGINFDNSLYPVTDDAGKIESVAVFAKDVTEQLQSKNIEDLFMRLGTVLMRWQMDAQAISQLFCDDILPVFDLAGAWLGIGDTPKNISISTHSEKISDDLMRQLETEVEQGLSSLPISPVLQQGLRQQTLLGDQDSPACLALARHLGAQSVLLLPLAHANKLPAVLALYGHKPDQFNSGMLQLRLAAIARRLGIVLEAARQQELLALLDSTLAQIKTPVMLVNSAGHVTWINNTCRQLINCPAETLPEHPVRIGNSDLLAPEFLAALPASGDENFTWRNNIVNEQSEGPSYRAMQTITALHKAGGEIDHYMISFEDIEFLLDPQ